MGGAKIQLFIAIIMIVSVFVLFTGSVIQVKEIRHYFPQNPELKTVYALNWLPILAVMPRAYVGFETTPQLSKNIADSQRKTQYIITLSLLSGFLFYMLIDYFSALNMRFDYAAISHSTWATGEGIQKVLGNTGIVILALAMLMSILSGINGFMPATYKVFESMIHENIWRSAQGKDEKTQHRNIILFICSLCLFSPWLGRNYLPDIVNMASLWISLGYLYVVCISLKVQKSQGNIKWLTCCALGIALLFPALLLLPFSPAAISGNAYYLLCLILFPGGFFFYRQFIRHGAN